jgi:DNA topoisomerase-2
MMNGQNPSKINPWYKGYTGEITEAENGYSVCGCYEVKDDNILEITELPIGKWTRDYKNFLEELA